MRGRKPKPTHLKLATGNPGRRPLNKSEPKPTLELPTPSAELSDDAAAEWSRVSVALRKAGLLSGIDRAALAAYCQAYGRWVMIKTTNGNAVQNPIVGTANKAMADMVRYAAEFGMTPSARSRIRAEGQEPEDLAETFFTG